MEYELYHHGVKGMKWGVRKKYITVAKAQRNASKAAEEARKKSVAESRASGDKGIGSFQRANRKALNAKRKAYSESIKNDRAYNQQLRTEKKASKTTSDETSKKDLTDKQKTAIKVGAAVAVTAVATYGAVKMSNCVRDNVYNRKVTKGLKSVQAAMEKGVGQRTIDSMLSDIGSYKKESLIKSVTSTIDNNRVGDSIDYKNVYKILSGRG